MSLRSGSGSLAPLKSIRPPLARRATSSLAISKRASLRIAECDEDLHNLGNPDGFSRQFRFTHELPNIHRSARSSRRLEEPGRRERAGLFAGNRRSFSSGGSKRSRFAGANQQSPFISSSDSGIPDGPNPINAAATSKFRRRPSIRKVKQTQLDSDQTDSSARHSDIVRGEQNQARLGEKVRAVMRHLPYPVAIITSTDISTSPEGVPSAWRGATVSSFNTVTLHPRPIVSFNIKKLSSTYEAIKSSGLFNVHLLHRTGKGTNIARKFSAGNASSPFHMEDGTLANYAVRQPVDWTRVSREGPQIGRKPPELCPYMDPRFLLRCSFLSHKAVEIEDHVVLFGEVTEAFADFHRIRDSGVLLYYVNGEFVTGKKSYSIADRPRNEGGRDRTGDNETDALKRFLEDRRDRMAASDTNPYTRFL